jgi:hypothetical protein
MITCHWGVTVSRTRIAIKSSDHNLIARRSHLEANRRIVADCINPLILLDQNLVIFDEILLTSRTIIITRPCLFKAIFFVK